MRDVRDVEDAMDDEPSVRSVHVVQPPVHHRVLIRQVEGVWVPEEDALRGRRGPHARREIDFGLGLLRAADLDGVEEAVHLRPVAEAGEGFLRLAPADAATARREVGRLAYLAVLP